MSCDDNDYLRMCVAFSHRVHILIVILKRHTPDKLFGRVTNVNELISCFAKSVFML
jgi:hypothetical protein